MEEKRSFFSTLSYKYKFSLMFILFGIVLTAISGIVIYMAEKRSLEHDFLQSVEYEMAGKENSVRWFLRDIQNSLNVLVKNSQNIRHLQHDEYINSFLNITANIVAVAVVKEDRVEKSYGHRKGINIQLRKALDRIDPKTITARLHLIDTFTQKGEPDTSLLILATRSELFNKSIILVAVNIDSLVNFIGKSHFSDLSIVDTKGNFLIFRDHIEPREKRVNFNTMYGDIAEDIMFSDIYVASQMYAKKMQFSGEEYLIMLEMDQKILAAKQKTLLYYAMLIFIMIILISLPLAYLFSILPDRLNRKISEQKRLFETLSEHSLAGVFLYQKTFRYTNPHFESYTGYDEKELAGLTMEDLFLSDPGSFGEAYKEALIRTKEGVEKWTYVGLNPTKLDNKPAFIGTLIDITELKRIQQELEHHAATDKLTALPNRVSFDTVFESMQKSGHPIYLAFFDIDHFKKINDTYGHDVGDEVLKGLASMLQRHFHRGMGHLFRWGGEEFIGLIDGTVCQDVEAFAEGLRQSIAETGMKTVGQITVSIGLARCKDEEPAEALIKRADEALYEAKEGGRNRVVSRV